VHTLIKPPTSEKHPPDDGTLAQPLSSLTEFLQPSNGLVAGSYQIIRDKILFTNFNERGEPAFAINWEKISTHQTEFIHTIMGQGSVVGLSTILCIGHVLNDGLKVFRPSDRDCEVMEMVDPNFPLNMYRQPYPAFVVELPSNYGKQRAVATEAGESRPDHRPLAIFGHFQPEIGVLYTMILMADGACLAGRLIVDKNSSKTAGQVLDESIAKIAAGGEEADRLVGASGIPLFGKMCNTLEIALHKQLLNIFFCASTLMVNYGAKTTDPNPSFRARLLANIEKAQKRKEPLAVPSMLNKMAPRVLTLAQNIELYRRESSPAADSVPTGRKVKPHWRCGFWRRQRCGVGNTEVRLRFIQAVLVNAADFAGNKSDTKTIYH
jgi:hypothetical protein